MAAMPLDGVRILDFTWVVAGPVATRILADHGAQVVKVERKNPPPLGNRKLGLQCDLHRDKLSVALNMQHPRGVELARRLAAMSDVVMDNFSARVMRMWGMDYQSLAADATAQSAPRARPCILRTCRRTSSHNRPACRRARPSTAYSP